MADQLKMIMYFEALVSFIFFNFLFLNLFFYFQALSACYPLKPHVNLTHYAPVLLFYTH